MLDFLRCFQWYRAWRGGTWYYVRGIYDMGRVVIFDWTQHLADGQYWVEKEIY